MSLRDWFHYNARQPVQLRETVDTDGIEVLEGEAAEISHRIYFDRQQRELLNRAFELLP